MSNLKLTALIALSGLGIAGRLAASVMLNVPGTSNIFLAGQASSPSAFLGTLPVEQDFIPVAGNVLTFTGPGFAPGQGITGTVSNESANRCPACANIPPDSSDLGSQLPATNISYSGTTISGIQFTGVEFFLVGVFLDAGLPKSQMSSIGDYGATGPGITPTQGIYTPLVGQTFFIGDGMTGNQTGAEQQFIVPTGATRLFLGFADALSFNGQAGTYDDNGGSLAVNLQIVPNPIPEPGTVALLTLGLAALACGRKKVVRKTTNQTPAGRRDPARQEDSRGWSTRCVTRTFTWLTRDNLEAGRSAT